MKQTKNLVRRTWFFQISFSEIMYRSTGTAFYKTIFSLNSYFRNFCWMIRTQPIPLFKLFLLYSFQWHFFQKFSKFLLFQGLQTRSQDLFALVRAMVAVEEEIEKETLLERIDAQTSNHMLMDSINSTNSLRSRKSMKSQASIISDDQGYINRHDNW